MKCKVDGCECAVIAQGLCNKHYKRQRTFGTVEFVPQNQKRCSVEGCANPARSKGLCAAHVARLYRVGTPELPVKAEEPIFIVAPVHGTCPVCASQFVPQRSDAVYCGLSCRKKAERARQKHNPDRLAKCSSCDEVIGDGSNGMCRSCFRKTRYAARTEHYKAQNKARRTHTGEHSHPSERAAIAEIYKATPPGADVDHIIPLDSWGDTVCGLHTVANLRYLTVAENRSRPKDPCPTDLVAWLEAELARSPIVFESVETKRNYVRTAPWPERLCSVEGCTAKHYGSGLCRSHYRKQRRESGVDHDKA